MKLLLERKVSVGDLLTVASILIGLVVGLLSWERDRELRRTEQANRVRAAAASTLVKLDRWEELSDSTYEQSKPGFIDIKEGLRKTWDVTGARHQLYKAILVVENDARQRILADHTELGYVDLYTYDPTAKEAFSNLLADLRDHQDDSYVEFLSETQDVMKKLETTNQKEYSADALYNALVRVTNALDVTYTNEIDSMLVPMREALINLIKESDAELLNNPKLVLKK